MRATHDALWNNNVVVKLPSWKSRLLDWDTVLRRPGGNEHPLPKRLVFHEVEYPEWEGLSSRECRTVGIE
jgi:hypothetical protein